MTQRLNPFSANPSGMRPWIELGKTIQTNESGRPLCCSSTPRTPRSQARVLLFISLGSSAGSQRNEQSARLSRREDVIRD